LVSDTGTKAFDGRRRCVALICGMRRTQPPPPPAVTRHGTCTCRAGLARPSVTPFTAGSRRADVSRNWHTSRMDYGCRDRTRRCVFVGRHSLPSYRALCCHALEPPSLHSLRLTVTTPSRNGTQPYDRPFTSAISQRVRAVCSANTDRQPTATGVLLSVDQSRGTVYLWHCDRVTSRRRLSEDS